MATNWQPPFGLPFPPPFPPPAQQSQQQAQPDAQNAPPDAYHPPSGYLPPPPPPPPPQQSWSIPGLNLQAHSQNAQQPQFPAAWPSTFPTPDQINQWSQMQMDMQQLPFMMMQNAPPLPGLGFASNAPSQSPFQAAAPTHAFPAAPPNPFPAPFPHQGSITPSTPHTLPMRNDRVTDVMETDKEDGELSEGGSKSPAANTRTHPEPPRSAPSSSARVANNPPISRQETYNPDQPAAGQVASHPKPVAHIKGPVSTLTQQRGDAKTFIKLLYNNNIGYHTLAAEGLDAAALRDLYRSMNLPSEPEPVPSAPKTNGTTQASHSNDTHGTAQSNAPIPNNSNPTTTVITNVPAAKSVPSPVPGNRAEYLKRLQAAKKGNHSGGSKATPPQKTPPPISTAPKSNPVSKTTESVNGVQSLTEDEKRAKTTELIRKRIEALKNSSSSPASAAVSNPPPTAAPTIPSSLPRRPPDVINPAFSTSTPQSVPASPFGNIPGLFMNASPVAPPSLVPLTPGHNNRKRPSSPGMDSTTSPQHLAPAQTKTSSPVVQTVPPQIELQSTPTLPSRPELRSRPTSVNPSMSGPSTPGPQTPSSTARGLELDEKARKQAALRERIQKRIEEQKQESERRKASAQNSPKLTSQQAHVLPASGIDQEPVREPKRRRKADVEAEQSAVDSEIAENAAKLAQITRELELLTANDAKLRQNKERLQAELESLGIDTEGMPHAELQARKDEIEREQHAASSTLSPAGIHSAPSLPTNTSSRSAPAHALPGLGGTAQQPKDTQQTTSGAIPGLNGSYPRAPVSSKAPKTPLPIASQALTQQFERPIKPLPAKPPVALLARDGIPDKPSPPVDDEEDFYSPEPGVSLPVPGQSQTTSASLAQTRSPSEEGEMAMSESEEEYEPEEALESQAVPQYIVIDGSDHAPSKTGSPISISSSSSASSSTDQDEDEEMYEPPDADQPMLDVERNAEPDKIEDPQPRNGEEEEMDMSTSSDDDSDSDTTSESSEDDPNEPAFSSNSKKPDPPMTVADTLAPELQPDKSAIQSTSQDAGVSSVTQDAIIQQDTANPKSFVPYESPLRHFKSYRYHPNFPQDVSSGFLSMTYSHQIDPDKQLCTAEASGESCSDANCPFQHYRDMEISGDKLLVQLGTANPGKTPEERQRWNDGLRAVLKDLRQKNSKDPNGIAMEIANFRRQFLQDDTRVVNL